jgi:hypothetical protein
MRLAPVPLAFRENLERAILYAGERSRKQMNYRHLKEGGRLA